MSEVASFLFDGRVFRPDSPIDLKPNTLCVITIQSEVPHTKRETLWDILDRMAGTIEGPGDWSIEHDHYLYGTPKRYAQEPE